MMFPNVVPFGFQTKDASKKVLGQGYWPLLSLVNTAVIVP